MQIHTRFPQPAEDADQPDKKTVDRRAIRNHFLAVFDGLLPPKDLSHDLAQVSPPHPQAHRHHRHEAAPGLPRQRLHAPDEGIGARHIVVDAVGDALLHYREQIEEHDAERHTGADQIHKADHREVEHQTDGGEISAELQGDGLGELELRKTDVEGPDQIKKDHAQRDRDPEPKTLGAQNRPPAVVDQQARHLH